ncbi:MAG: Holliday junction resolvase-like protein [Thermoplasmata archaeon]
MTSIVEYFQAFRSILCVCPCCGELVRLSDLSFTYKGKTPRTWLDTHETKLKRLERKEERFEEEEEEIREAARERGRKKIPGIIRKIDPTFVKLKYHPKDVKALMHPVDFIAFEGLADGDEIRNVTFIGRRRRLPRLTSIRTSIKKAIGRKDLEWQTLRVDAEGRIEIR